MKKLISRRSAAKIFPSAAILLLALPALAAVDGTVMNGTVGKPQAGATVTLFKLGQAGPESIQSVKSDAQGKFHIDRALQGPNLIQTTYDGVVYNHVLAPGSASTGLVLNVYNSSKQPGDARVARHFLIFQPSGAQMTVDEGFQFSNNGKMTYNDPESGTFKFYLPSAANGKVEVKATAPHGMPIDATFAKTREKDAYKVDFPIKPGETDFQISYTVPYSSGDIFEGKLLDKTVEPTLLVVPNGITIQGEGLESKGTEPRSQASIYSVAARDFKVQISGLAPSADADTGDSGPSIEEVSPRILRQNMKWILALAFGILVLGFIVLYRAQPSPDPRAVPAKGKNESGRR